MPTTTMTDPHTKKDNQLCAGFNDKCAKDGRLTDGGGVILPRAKHNKELKLFNLFAYVRG